MIGGIYGKILHVNLTTGKTHIETPPEEFYRLLVGGRALVAYFLLRDLPAKTDPLSPDNLLILLNHIRCAAFELCPRTHAGNQLPRFRQARGGWKVAAHRGDWQLRVRRLVGE